MSASEPSPTLASKPHYELLDGLRGVAALLVVIYHVFEGIDAVANNGAVITVLNHGYLAVDFFFMLSGFVMSYAYDDRLGRSMSTGAFFLRRLVRLHPMMIIAACIGLLSFGIQNAMAAEGAAAPWSMVAMAFFCACLFIPAWPGAGFDVRGNGEIFPLNGPAWSLFFEYVANVVYGLLLFRLSTRGLSLLVALLGAGLCWYALSDASGYGMISVGWTFAGTNVPGALLRLFFPFTAGMLMARLYRPAPGGLRRRGGFEWGCLLLPLLFAVPALPAWRGLHINGLYELACIALAFPCVLLAGASSRPSFAWSAALCRVLGRLSYPLYAVHYPVMYLFYAWLLGTGVREWADAWPAVLLVVTASLLLAWLSSALWDEPIRRFLRRKLSIR